MYCILFFLLIMNVSFSQSIKETIGSQFEKIALLPKEGEGFIVGAFIGNRIYILQRAKDSLMVTSYATTVNDGIGGVHSILVNDDSLFSKKVDILYSDIKKNHSYQSYSKEVLAGGNFFLTFYENNKLQIFSGKEASQNQLTNMDYILNRLNGYSFIPYKGHKRRSIFLNITNLNELLKYLKNV